MWLQSLAELQGLHVPASQRDAAALVQWSD
jgi:hypothetical protein